MKSFIGFNMFILMTYCIVLSPMSSIVAYWSFGEMSNILVKDYSGKDNNAQVVGDPESVRGKSGKGLEFDGIRDFLVVPNRDSYNFGKNDSFTICLWLKYYPKDDWQGILQKIDTAYAYDIGVQPDNKIYFAISDGSNVTKLIIGDLSGQWHHLCFVRDTTLNNLVYSIDPGLQTALDEAKLSEQLKEEFKRNGSTLAEDSSITIKDKGNEWEINSNQQTYRIRKEGVNLNVYTDAIYVYIDGKPTTKTEDKTSGEIENKSDLYIGARGPGDKMLFKGVLDEVAIYDSILSAHEVRLAYKGFLPDIYKENRLRRFEIVSTVSIPFTAIHSYLIVRGIEMARQRRVAPKFSNANWNTVGGLTIIMSACIGLWDYLKTRDKDIIEVAPSFESPKYGGYRYQMSSGNMRDSQLLSLNMGF